MVCKAMSKSPMQISGNLLGLVLAVLDDAPLHGYGIAREIESRSADALSFGEGTLYPALKTLERDGFVQARWDTSSGNGPARKVYEITPRSEGGIREDSASLVRIFAVDRASDDREPKTKPHLRNPMLIPERNQANAEREIYLVEVTRCLAARLSPLEVYEAVTELRDPIDAMAAAHEELGLDAESAIRLSLKKFGEPKRLGESLGQASGRRGRRRPSTLPATFGLTLLTTWVSMFRCLLPCDFLFLVSFHGEPDGLAAVKPHLVCRR